MVIRISTIFEYNLPAGFNLIFVIIAEISQRSQITVFIKFKTQFFINTGFRFEITVTYQIAATAASGRGGTTIAFAVQHITVCTLVQIRNFVGTCYSAFNQPVRMKLL